ncbi:hypothetical protein J1614_005373 [Plenodomus biglobosus]|nr:hypothetical protein J1614_005373 [Plenodomus biglobosus]
MHSDYDSIRWIAGAVACGISSAVMLLTGTVHPPGGASAVMAVTEPAITAMGWYFVGLILWGTTLMLVVGLLINNIQRQFPMYWWTPLDVRRAKRLDEETVPDAQGGLERRESQYEQRYNQDGERIEINGAEVVLPDDLSLNEEEAKVLENLRERLRKRVDAERKLGALDEKERRSARSSAECTIVPSHSGSSRDGIPA